ncbi:MAG: hypothetical protein AAGB03_11440, partial [Pseudomonadota bacterium]
ALTDDNPEAPTLAQVGDGVTVGETLTAGAFHPSGDWFLIPDVAWGSNSKPADFLFNGRGALVTIRFDANGLHSLNEVAQVGRSPEGFAISPDGLRVVTVNMNRTYLPSGFPTALIPGRIVSSLSLLAFDPSSGTTTLLDEKGYRGALPEDAVFDAKGTSLGVTLYEQPSLNDSRGFVEWWDIEDDTLVRTGQVTPVVRGVHDLVTLP